MRFVFNGADDALLNKTPIEISREAFDHAGIRTAGDALQHLYAMHRETHRSFFGSSGQLANGTICVINESDWEITGEEQSPVHHGDELILISSLHGG